MKKLKSPWPKANQINPRPRTVEQQPQLWYGLCTYLTEDWSKLKRGQSGIPVCPSCGSPGFIVLVEHYWAAVKQYDETHPGYEQIVRDNMEYCNFGGKPDFEQLWIQKYHPESYRGKSRRKLVDDQSKP